MSKGKFLTKRKWRNGQRQKGATKSCGNGGHKAPPWSDLKYPRNSKFMKLFDSLHLAMKMSMRIQEIEYIRWGLSDIQNKYEKSSIIFPLAHLPDGNLGLLR